MMFKSFVSLGLILCVALVCKGVSFRPISDSHRSAVLELLKSVDESSRSVEEAYEALRTSDILGVGKELNIEAHTCPKVVEALVSPSASLKDLFYSLRVNKILKCETKNDVFAGIASRIRASVLEAKTLLDFYYSVGCLGLIKDQASEIDVQLADADGIFQSIKALSQSDGRWRYSSNNPASSSYAAGVALETLAGVVSLATSEVDESLIGTLKNDISKLFDSTEKYDDGAFYFDEKVGDTGPLLASSSVIRGLTAFAAVTSKSIHLPGDKILGLAKYFLSIGVPGKATDLYNQMEALACLEDNRVSIPLIVSLPSTVLSLTTRDQLKVKVNTVLGSAAPPLSVKLMQASSSGSKDASVFASQELKFDQQTGFHILDTLPNNLDVGEYIFSFQIVFHDPENKKVYATGGRTKVPLYVTGEIKINKAEIAVLDNLGSIETLKKLDLAGKNDLSLSANHLQKLHLSFQLATPLGQPFEPHQAFLKLIHETKVEQIFVLGNSGKQLEIVLGFFGLVEKFFHLSGKYEIQLAVGDAVMENSFLQDLGSVDLDLPEAPEKATRPLAQAVDLYTRYEPKAEISHIFRAPEKRPPQQLSLAFLALIFLPFLGFLVGLLQLGVNMNNFPSSTAAIFAILFHLGIAAVLSLYLLFWLKLDLFTTLKALGFLGVFLMFVGHRTLSHIASTSAKLKSA